MTINLRQILNDYQADERGLPDFRECSELAVQIAVMQADIKFYKDSYEMLIAEING